MKKNVFLYVVIAVLAVGPGGFGCTECPFTEQA